MTHDDQLRAFAGELHDLVRRYADEFDVDAVAVLGILRMQMRVIEDDLIERVESGEKPPGTPG